MQYSTWRQRRPRRRIAHHRASSKSRLPVSDSFNSTETQFLWRQSINQSIIYQPKKHATDREEHTNRHNQAETVLIVDLETLNQFPTNFKYAKREQLKLNTVATVGIFEMNWSIWSAVKISHAFMTLSAKKFDLTEMLLWCLKSL